MDIKPHIHSPTPARPGSQRASVSVGFVQGILSGLEYQPGRRAALLNHAGLANPAADTSAGAGRVPLARYTALYRQIVAELGDEAFGLLSRPLRPGCFAWLARGALSAPTLADALQRIANGLNLLQDNLELALQPTTDGLQLSISVTQPLPVGPDGFVFAHEWLLRLIHGLSAWLVAHPLPLPEAAFPYPAPNHASEYEALFAGTIRFDAPALRADFPADWLGLPVRRDERELQVFLESAPASITILYRAERQLAPRVRQMLRAALPGFISLQTAAAKLDLSPRTLHRRLLAEQTSYRHLREAVRRERACELLAKTRQSITEIASALGFADATAFYRAFLSWEGCGPRDWRRGRKAEIPS